MSQLCASYRLTKAPASHVGERRVLVYAHAPILCRVTRVLFLIQLRDIRTAFGIVAFFMALIGTLSVFALSVEAAASATAFNAITEAPISSAYSAAAIESAIATATLTVPQNFLERIEVDSLAAVLAHLSWFVFRLILVMHHRL